MHCIHLTLSTSGDTAARFVYHGHGCPRTTDVRGAIERAERIDVMIAQGASARAAATRRASADRFRSMNPLRPLLWMRVALIALALPGCGRPQESAAMNEQLIGAAEHGDRGYGNDSCVTGPQNIM